MTNKELLEQAAAQGYDISGKPVTVVTGQTSAKTTGVKPADRIDTDEYKTQLDQMHSAARTQATDRIDNATRLAAAQLNRAEADAAPQYQTLRNQIDRNEQQALDKSALYAELRGDRGGIGKAQYDSVQNTAAQNRLAVQQEQTRLSTDTARQVADLRAQGEFEKADALLSLSQNYLSQLMSLEQWAADYNLNVGQLNNALQQWQIEFDENAKRYTDSLNYQAGRDAYQKELDDYAKAQDEQSQLSSIAKFLLSAGVPLTDAQRKALNMEPEQETEYRNLLFLKNAASGGGGRGGSKSSGSDEDIEPSTSNIWLTDKKKEQAREAYAARGTTATGGTTAANETTATIGEPMTRSEWNRRKTSTQIYGGGADDVTYYDVYDDYLAAWNRRKAEYAQ